MEDWLAVRHSKYSILPFHLLSSSTVVTFKDVLKMARSQTSLQFETWNLVGWKWRNKLRECFCWLSAQQLENSCWKSASWIYIFGIHTWDFRYVNEKKANKITGCAFTDTKLLLKRAIVWTCFAYPRLFFTTQSNFVVFDVSILMQQILSIWICLKVHPQKL